ncbi:MAG: phage tail length tape measure family protein [Pseudomonadota bacterium]
MANLDIVARLQLEASQFSSEGGRAVADLTGKLDKAGRELRHSFSANMAEVQKLAQTALIVPRTEGGALNLAPEITALNSRAVAFEQNAIAARELQQALLATAAAGKGDTEALLREADAAMLAARAHDLEADALRERADVLGHVQSNLVRTTTATVAHSDATKGATDSTGAMRFAMQGLSYQAQDVFTQLSMGANVFQVLAIQGGQAAGAFANVEGKAGALGRFLIGPWGLAITAGLLAFGPMVSKLWESSSAAEEAAKRLTQAATAADSFGTAQSLLGRAIDLTTGKMKTQNEVLLQTIRLQAQANLEAANKKILEAGDGLGIARKEKARSIPIDPNVGSFSMGGVGFASADTSPQQRQLRAMQQALFAAVNNDKLAGSDPSAYSRAIGVSLDQQIAKLDKLAVSGKFAGKSLADAKLELIQLAAVGNDKSAALMSKSVLNGRKVPDELTPYEKDKKPKKDPKPKDYTRADNGLAVQLAEMNAQWEHAPTLIEKANIATLKLDNMYQVLSKRKLTPEVQTLLDTIGKVRESIRTGLDEPYRQFVETQQQGMLVQRLILEGRTAEATALQSAVRLTQSQGTLDERRLANVLQLAKQQEAIALALEDQRRIVGMYVGSVSDMQQSFNAFLNDLHSPWPTRGSYPLLASRPAALILRLARPAIWRSTTPASSGAARLLPRPMCGSTWAPTCRSTRCRCSGSMAASPPRPSRFTHRQQRKAPRREPARAAYFRCWRGPKCRHRAWASPSRLCLHGQPSGTSISSSGLHRRTFRSAALCWGSASSWSEISVSAPRSASGISARSKCPRAVSSSGAARRSCARPRSPSRTSTRTRSRN